MKLRYPRISGQDKHLRDIRAMLAISPEQCDRLMIEHWVRHDGTQAAWDVCSATPGAE